VGKIGSLNSGRDLHVNSSGGILTLESNFNSTERQVVLGDSYFGVVTNDDNAVDLGRSSARYKNLYLSGGAYIGGTGSANYLDDYEEGTFTASFNGSTSNPTISYSSQVGTYIKVGNLVQVTVSVIASGTPSGGGGNLRISGLPFTSKSGVQQAGTVAFTNTLSATSGTTQMSCNIEESDTVIHINEHEYSGTSSMSRMQVSALHNSSPRIVCSIAYEIA
jgi:hypothetical protein